MHKNHLDWANLEDNPIDKDQIVAEIDQQLAQEYHDEEIPEVALQKEEVEDTEEKTNAAIFSTSMDENQELPVMQVYQPLSYRDTQTIALQLKAGQVAIIDFVQTEEKIASRIVDFLTGLVYGLDGDIVHFKEKQYICAPKGISLTEEFLNRFRATS